ncbi:hypothetical protein ACHMW7_03860 [Aminobacter sp. UC22_36]|uniref:hypothetical protein n=1 Tax=Aminobacter sp. UC22_36 TaxID=3374549 RepID=UPI00375693FF
MWMTVQAYVLVEQLELPEEALTLTKGTMVFQCVQGTYGLVDSDTRMTGRPHIAITFDPDGGYPFYAVPLSMLRPV